MPYTLFDNDGTFETLSIAALNGQDSWTTTGAIEVAAPPWGGKAMKVPSGTVGGVEASNPFAAVASGDTLISMTCRMGVINTLSSSVNEFDIRLATTGGYTIILDMRVLGTITGTAATGSATTITLAGGAVAIDDFYNGWTCEITAGTSTGSIGTFTDYVGSTKIATVASWSAGSPDNTSVYEVVPPQAGIVRMNVNGSAILYDMTAVQAADFQLEIHLDRLTGEVQVIADGAIAISLTGTPNAVGDLWDTFKVDSIIATDTTIWVDDITAVIYAPPVASNVAITPSPAKDLDDLVVTYDYSSPSNDTENIPVQGDSRTTNIQWYRVSRPTTRIYSEDFNTFTVGDVNAQGTWVAPVAGYADNPGLVVTASPNYLKFENALATANVADNEGAYVVIESGVASSELYRYDLKFRVPSTAADGNALYQISDGVEGPIVSFSWDSNGVDITGTSFSNLSLDVWHSLVVTIDWSTLSGSTVTITVDVDDSGTPGSFAGSTTFSAPIGDHSFIFGSYASFLGAPFGGEIHIDDVVIYNVAATAVEITAYENQLRVPNIATSPGESWYVSVTPSSGKTI